MGGSVPNSVSDAREGEFASAPGAGERLGVHGKMARELRLGVELREIGDVHAHGLYSHSG